MRYFDIGSFIVPACMFFENPKKRVEKRIITPIKCPPNKIIIANSRLKFIGTKNINHGQENENRYEKWSGSWLVGMRTWKFDTIASNGILHHFCPEFGFNYSCDGILRSILRSSESLI